MTSYKCLKCSYKCKLFNDMTRHLNKNNSCPKILDGYNYSEEELLKLSLMPYRNNEQNIDIKILKKKFKLKVSKNKLFEALNEIEKKRLRDCPLCNLSFEKKCDLKKHIILECVNIDCNINDKKEESKLKNMCNIINSNNTINNNDITNNNINNNDTTNNYNIINNINIISPPVSFDDDWDISHMDSNEKTVLIISMFKYTKTLESLLKNKNNHNVIIDKESKSGLVYNNNNIETMSLDEICDKSVDKLNNHLNKFVDEVIKNNDNNSIDLDYILHSKKVIRLKQSNYKYYEKDKNIINEMLIDKYDNVKDETLKNFNIIKNDNDHKIKF